MYKISLLMALTLYVPHSYAMLPQGQQLPPARPIQIQTDGYIARVSRPSDSNELDVYGFDPSKVDVVRDPRNLTCCTNIPTQTKHPVVIAAEQGDLEVVKAYFNSWKRYFEGWDHYDRGVAELLDHVARFPAETTAPVARFLLEKVTFSEIKQPDCVRKNALINGHVEILTYLNPHAPEPMAWELVDAVIHRQDAALTNLLKAGVNPDIGVGNRKKEVVIRQTDEEAEIAHGVQHPLHTAIFRGNTNAVRLLLQHRASVTLKTVVGDSPLDVALKSFASPQDNDNTAALRRRLYILRTVLNAMPIETVPSLEYVQAKIATLSQETQSKIMGVLNNRLRPCMSDDAPTAAIQQEESGFAFGASILCCTWLARVAMDVCVNWKKLNWQELKDSIKKDQ